jgi:hypothetical protein
MQRSRPHEDPVAWTFIVTGVILLALCLLPPGCIIFQPLPPARPPVPYYPATNMVDPVTQEVPNVILP